MQRLSKTKIALEQVVDAPQPPIRAKTRIRLR
jgi:hypothetical protein